MHKFIATRKMLFPLATLCLIAGGSACRAQDAFITFDVPRQVAVRPSVDHHAPDPASSADGRIIPIHLPISTWVRDHKHRKPFQITYELRSLEPGWPVVDFEPKTALESPIVGPIAVEGKQETSRSASVNANGTLDHWIKAVAIADWVSRTHRQTKYQRQPPRTLLTASGTLARGSGVYFKLNPSEQTTLEGSRAFQLTLRVPADWSADLLHVTCRAESLDTRGRTDDIIAQQQFLVALYQVDAPQALRRVRGYGAAERRLLIAAHEYETEIHQRRYDHAAHRMATLLDVAQPKIPRDWLTQILTRPSSSWPFLQRLPEPVREAAEQYLQARDALRGAERGRASQVDTRVSSVESDQN